MQGQLRAGELPTRWPLDPPRWGGLGQRREKKRAKKGERTDRQGEGGGGGPWRKEGKRGGLEAPEMPIPWSLELHLLQGDRRARELGLKCRQMDS